MLHRILSGEIAPSVAAPTYGTNYRARPPTEAASVAYCFLAPHLLSLSIHTPPAFSQSALFFASSIPAKAGAVKAVATVKAIIANRSLFMGVFPY